MQSFKHLTVHWLCMASPWGGRGPEIHSFCQDPYKAYPGEHIAFPDSATLNTPSLTGKNSVFVARTRFLDVDQKWFKKIWVLPNHLVAVSVNESQGQGGRCGYIPVPLLTEERKVEGHLLIAVSASYIEWPGAGTQTSLWAGWGSAVPAVTVQETRLSLYLENNFLPLRETQGMTGKGLSSPAY